MEHFSEPSWDLEEGEVKILFSLLLDSMWSSRRAHKRHAVQTSLTAESRAKKKNGQRLLCEMVHSIVSEGQTQGTACSRQMLTLIKNSARHTCLTRIEPFWKSSVLHELISFYNKSTWPLQMWLAKRLGALGSKAVVASRMFTSGGHVLYLYYLWQQSEPCVTIGHLICDKIKRRPEI